MAQLRRPSDKTQRIILREAEKAGWLIRNTRSGWQCLSPDGKAAVTMHTSSSDHRAIRAIIADFRRAGLDLKKIR